MTTTVTNEVLAYVPELKEHVKSAEQIDNLPTGSRGETLFSYVKVGYLEKIAGMPVDTKEKSRVLKASTLYGIEKEAQEMIKRIVTKVQVKQAHEMEKQAGLVVAQDSFEAMESGFVNVDKMVKMARALDDAYPEDVTSLSVKQYACSGYLNKQAAERSFRARYQATHDPVFEKLAEALDKLNTDNFSIEEKRKFADFVQDLDKKAQLSIRGFNIYKEIFMDKEAAASSIMVKLPGKSVSIEKIAAIAPDLQGALGKDVVNELCGDPMNAKHVVDSLPLDMKTVIARYV